MLVLECVIPSNDSFNTGFEGEAAASPLGLWVNSTLPKAGPEKFFKGFQQIFGGFWWGGLAAWEGEWREGRSTLGGESCVNGILKKEENWVDFGGWGSNVQGVTE